MGVLFFSLHSSSFFPGLGRFVCLVLFCLKHRIVQERNVLYADKLPSEVFKNGWVTKVRKRLHTSLYSTLLLQREEQEGPRFRFFFLLFFLARCCTPTNLPNVLIISTTCTRPVQLSSHSSQSYTGTIFLSLVFLHHFLLLLLHHHSFNKCILCLLNSLAARFSCHFVCLFFLLSFMDDIVK